MPRRAPVKSNALPRLVLIALALVFALVAARTFWELPSDEEVAALATRRPHSTSIIATREREAAEAHRAFHLRQRWTPLDQIAPELIACVIASEDARFFVHDGVDLHQLRDALGKDLREHRWARGASTLTQQLAKNLWLSERKSISRKLVELVLAERLESNLSKARILELYLNEVEWGDGIFGIGAASRTWFDESPRALSLGQSAILAAMLPAPRRLSPHPGARELLERANHVLDRVAEEHLASTEAVARARDEIERVLAPTRENEG